jgi:TRAP-type mannitol/chloroaromatic compound transport system permease small subunit
LIAATPTVPRRPLLTLARLVAWLNLAALTAYLVDVALSFYLPLHTAPLANPALQGAWHDITLPQFVLYTAAPLAATGAALSVGIGRSAGADAERIADVANYLVRAFFWAVVFVGVADFAVALLRVEGILPGLVGDDLASALSRSSYRGLHMHLPAIGAGFVVAVFRRALDFYWLSLLIVLAQVLIVLSRFVFSFEQALMTDLVRLWYAALFLLASAHALAAEAHVRVDVLYSGFGETTRHVVNATGAVLFGWALCWIILIVGCGSKTGVINAPMLAFETTLTGFGMQVKYLMAGLLGVFAVTMLLQFTSLFLASCAGLAEPGDSRRAAR